MFVNDLPDVLEGKVLMFADDLKLIAPRRLHDSTENNLRSACKWAEAWDLPLNEEKSCHIAIGQPPTGPLIFNNGKVLSTAVSTTDLGLLVSETYKTTDHCRKAVSRARALLFQIKRGFADLTPEIFRPLYVALVRPILEYGIQAASPYLQSDVDSVGKLQRLATRMVKGLRERPYCDHLKALHIFSLARRRIRGDLITAFNIFSGRLDIDLHELIHQPNAGKLRGHPFKMQLKKFKKGRRRAAFSLRVTKAWNSLPEAMVLSESTKAFKNALDDGWPQLFGSN